MANLPWAVTGQEQVMAKDLTGSYVQAVRVFFTVGPDGPFSIDVPVALFTPEYVKQLVADYASHVVAVSDLST